MYNVVQEPTSPWGPRAGASPCAGTSACQSPPVGSAPRDGSVRGTFNNNNYYY